MKNIAKVFVLALAVCSVLAGCAVTEPVDGAAVVVPVVPVKPAEQNQAASAADETSANKLETKGIAPDFTINAKGLEFYIFTLSPNQIALKYPAEIRFEEMYPAAESFSANYPDILRDAVLAVDEDNKMAVLTFSGAIKEDVLRDFENGLSQFIPTYIDGLVASAPAKAETVDIKMPESKSAASTAVASAPEKSAAPAQAVPAAPAAAAVPAAPVQAAPEAKANEKSNAGTIILVVVIAIIAISCVVYFVNRKKQQN